MSEKINIIEPGLLQSEKERLETITRIIRANLGTDDLDIAWTRPGASHLRDRITIARVLKASIDATEAVLMGLK